MESDHDPAGASQSLPKPHSFESLHRALIGDLVSFEVEKRVAEIEARVKAAFETKVNALAASVSDLDGQVQQLDTAFDGIADNTEFAQGIQDQLSDLKTTIAAHGQAIKNAQTAVQNTTADVSRLNKFRMNIYSTFEASMTDRDVNDTAKATSGAEVSSAPADAFSRPSIEPSLLMLANKNHSIRDESPSMSDYVSFVEEAEQQRPVFERHGASAFTPSAELEDPSEKTPLRSSSEPHVNLLTGFVPSAPLLRRSIARDSDATLLNALPLREATPRADNDMPLSDSVQRASTQDKPVHPAKSTESRKSSGGPSKAVCELFKDRWIAMGKPGRLVDFAKEHMTLEETPKKRASRIDRDYDMIARPWLKKRKGAATDGEDGTVDKDVGIVYSPQVKRPRSRQQPKVVIMSDL